MKLQPDPLAAARDSSWHDSLGSESLHQPNSCCTKESLRPSNQSPESLRMILWQSDSPYYGVEHLTVLSEGFIGITPPASKHSNWNQSQLCVSLSVGVGVCQQFWYLACLAKVHLKQRRFVLSWMIINETDSNTKYFLWLKVDWHCFYFSAATCSDL